VSTFPDHALSKSQEAWPGAEQGWESLREPRSKRRKAGAPRMARSRAADELRRRRRLATAARGTWLACAFRRFASLFVQEANPFLRVVVCRARARRRSETGVVCASLRAPAKQPRGFRKRLDCFVAVAPRNDAIRSDFHPAHSAPGYSLLAIPPTNSAVVPEPDGPNEKESTMSLGFCLKWLSTERRTISASAANGFLS
jgi:hypothetical protein